MPWGVWLPSPLRRTGSRWVAPVPAGQEPLWRNAWVPEPAWSRPAGCRRRRGPRSRWAPPGLGSPPAGGKRRGACPLLCSWRRPLTIPTLLVRVLRLATNLLHICPRASHTAASVPQVRGCSLYSVFQGRGPGFHHPRALPELSLLVFTAPLVSKARC